jgi:hypothetical protein
MKLQDAERMGVVWRVLVERGHPMTADQILTDAKRNDRIRLGAPLRCQAASMTVADVEAAAKELLKRGHIEWAHGECVDCLGRCCHQERRGYRPVARFIQERETA